MRDAKQMFEMQSFRISGRKTCMSAHHFLRLFLHPGSRNLNVEPPFSPVGQTVYYFTISFRFGSRLRFLHLGWRNLNVEPPFSPIGRTLPELFLHLGQPILHCMSAKRIPACKGSGMSTASMQPGVSCQDVPSYQALAVPTPACHGTPGLQCQVQSLLSSGAQEGVADRVQALLR